MTTIATTEVRVEFWSPAIKVPTRHVNLSETLDSIQHGIDQAAKGEGMLLDTTDLPTDDDD